RCPAQEHLELLRGGDPHLALLATADRPRDRGSAPPAHRRRGQGRDAGGGVPRHEGHGSLHHRMAPAPNPLSRALARNAYPLAVAALLVSKITWTDRPHLFTLALFPVLLELLLSLPAGASRRLFVFPPLLLVWSYLHGGYLIGLAVLAIFAAHAVLVSGRAGLPLAATTIVSAALTLLNPAPLELAGAA